MTKFKVLQTSVLPNSVLASHDGATTAGKEKKQKMTASFPDSPVKIPACVLLAVIFCFFSLAGVASANEPWFHVESGARPTYLPPPAENEEGELENGKGEVIVTVANLGNANTTGPVTIADTLPAGLKAVSMQAAVHSLEAGGSAGEELECPSTAQLKKSATGASLSCVLQGYTQASAGHNSAPKSLGAVEDIEVRIGVEVLPSARVCEQPTAPTCEHEQNAVTVSGGGAPSVPPVSRPLTVSAKPVPFGVESYEVTPEEEGGAPATRAGEHPFQVTGTLTLDQTASTGKEAKNSTSYEAHPVALTKDLAGLLPPGLVGNPTPFPRCPLEQLIKQDCPQQTVVGAAIITTEEPATLGLGKFDIPIVNLEPAHGEPARFGFYTAVPTILDAHVRSGGDYGITLSTSDIPQVIGFVNYKLTFWGVPGAAAHDSTRGFGCIDERHEHSAEFVAEHGFTACTPVGEASPPPLLTLPTACAVNPVTHRPEALYSSTEADSWVQPQPEGQRPVFGEHRGDARHAGLQPAPLRTVPEGHARRSRSQHADGLDGRRARPPGIDPQQRKPRAVDAPLDDRRAAPGLRAQPVRRGRPASVLRRPRRLRPAPRAT